MHRVVSLARAAVGHLPSCALVLCAAGAMAAEMPPTVLGEPSGRVAAGSTDRYQPTVQDPGGTATLYWIDPTELADGAALTDLAGYRLYYGKSPSDLSAVVQLPDASASSYTIKNLSRATWYFAITAYTATGLESPRSEIVSKIVN